MRRILAISRLTWKSAFRYRIFWVVAAALMGAVVGLPLVLKDDGTAMGLTQIVLTYTLSSVSVLLGFTTLWLSCGTLARDVEECQIQMVACKPISRWQIWMGKWLGILALNAMLLAISGTSIYLLLVKRSHSLPAMQQEIIQDQIFVARAAAKERAPDLTKATEEVKAQWYKDHPKAKLTQEELTVMEDAWAGRARSLYESVDPGYVKEWSINLSSLPESVRAKPMRMRIRFHTATTNYNPLLAPTYGMIWRVGPADSPAAKFLPEDLPPDSYQEITLPPILDPKGILHVECKNMDPAEQLFFPIEDGFEVLYWENTFAVNFARGLMVILCWLALLSAVGLASASFLSFPVAAFCSLAILFVGLSTSTLAEVQQQKSIFLGGQNPNMVKNIIDDVTVPVFDAVLKITNLVQGFSPVESLSTGHSITWGQLGRALEQIVLIMGGFFCLAGILLFNRRELAAPQVNS